ncbi:MAG: 50S ribosomal protein L3 [Nitrospirae bacterium]|nr:50S ribosomal protein L3 [Nitrospirota bacterium]
MTGIVGKKLGMTQVFGDAGRIIPVTVIEASPGCVVGIKTNERDGYEAVKIGFFEVIKEKTVNKPMLGVFKKAGTKPYKVLREFPMTGLKVGDMITVERFFSKGDIVSVSGISKGKGFQGVMKRHGYKGGPGSHGSMFNRAPGSIGASSFPSRVWKGKGMPGHMGSERVTTESLTVVDVRENLLLLKGSVPGSKNSVLEITKED